jgi:glycosyltransferase involved in cell wall biosynthesis
MNIPKKSVLFVRPSMGYGGADKVTLNILQNLDRERFIPFLALMRAEGENMSMIPNDVEVFDLKASRLWYMLKPLKQLLKEKTFDIVYSTSGGTNIPLLMIPAKLRKSSTVVVSERTILLQTQKSKFKSILMLTLKRWLYPRADFVTAVSKGIAEEIVRMIGVDKRKVQVVNNPIVTKELISKMNETVTHQFFSNDKPSILMVGRLVPQKNYPMMFRALKKLEPGLDAHLFILGKGPIEADLKKLAQEYEIANQITFMGYNDNPFKYMSKCSVFVLSSNHEGMPGVLIQAMACGAACVSTDCHTGPADLIEDGINGRLVKTDDDSALTSVLMELIKNRTQARKLGQQAQQSVDKYHMQAGINSYISFLN